jgi:predicted chitinase
MDGLSGIKIYNKLEVNTEFLPKAYGNNMDLIVTGVNHRLSNNDWETDIEATIIPKSSNLENITISTKSIQNSVNNINKTALQKPTKNPPNDVIQAMKIYGIKTPLEKAHFLAQISHESAQFRYREEIASGAAYEGRADLGNTQPGDGKRYKGRGYMQLTGRDNYKEYNNYLKSRGITDDVLKNPSLVATKYAADVSAWYWTVLGPKGIKKFNKKANEGSSVKIVKKISEWVNGNPPNHLTDRINKFNYYWSILKINPVAFT